MSGFAHNWQPRLNARWARCDDVHPRLPEIIQCDQLVSWMNSTRWRELRDSPAWQLIRRYRCACLDGDPKDVELWAPWDEFMPILACVEWLDLDVSDLDEPKGSRAKRIVELKALLRSLSIRFTTEGRYIRIWGYTRPGATPQFE
ncbi:MAG: hypothetical protein KF699_06945 [Phycisphaeraceae bacterium]|nr:hypothetical protein [Phycisphaeraceae bacterium]